MPFKDPEKSKEYHRLKHLRYRAENPEKYKKQRREAMRRCRAANPERTKAQGKKDAALFRERHPEKVLETNRNWYAENLEAARLSSRIRGIRWQENNPKAAKAAQQRGNIARQARENDAAGDFTQEQIEARVALFGYCCAYCGGPYQHLDHVIPLSKGGTNWPSNLRPACKKCNCSKNNKDWRDWPIMLQSNYDIS